MGIGKPDTHSGRIIINQILNKYGLYFTKLKENPDDYSQIKGEVTHNIDKDEIIQSAIDDIEGYSTIFNKGLLKSFNKSHVKTIANRFFDVALEQSSKDCLIPKDYLDDYIGLRYDSAKRLFTINYLKEQFYGSEQNAQAAAEKSGMTFANYRQHLNSRGIKIQNLKK